MASRWRLHAFGIARLEAADAGVRAIELTRKDAALLFYVAREGVVASARTAELLWPGGDQKSALNNCRQRLHRLRKASGGRLLEMTDTIALAGDLQVMPDDALARVSEDPGADIAALLGSHEYDAEPEFAAWLAAQRRARAEAVVDALAGIAARHERDGALALALRFAQRLVALAPLSEHAHRRVMRLHYLRGDGSAAVAAFEACERVLKDELGARPSAETLELLKTIEDALPRPVQLAAPLPAALMRPPRTVGRDAAAERLARAHAQGHRAIVVGEAGIGKTRLLHDFAAGRDDVVMVQARPSDAGVPFGTLARLVRALRGAVPTLVQDAERPRLAALLSDSIIGDAATPSASLAAAPSTLASAPPASPTPGPPSSASPIPALEAMIARLPASGVSTLVIDDLHFGDRASIETLRVLVDAPALDGLRWVFAHRPAPTAEADAALLEALAEGENTTLIALEPLVEVDVEVLLESVGIDALRAHALAPALRRHSGGNPLYLIETMRALAASGQHGPPRTLPSPESITQLIDRRLRKLTPPALSLARVAAVAVPDFSTALAEQALGVKAIAMADAWRELEAAGVLDGEAFAHDLVHDAVRRATPEAIARHAHGEVAAFLVARGAEPARVARHWLSAGAGAQAGDAYRAAAARALAAGRLLEQHELLALAVKGYTMAGDGTRAAKARIDAAQPLMESRGPDAALAWIDAGAAGATDPSAIASSLAARASALLHARRPDDAEAAARQALDAAPAGDAVLRVSSARLLAQALAQQRRTAEALALFRAWQPDAERIDDAGTRIDFLGDHVTALMMADRPLEALPLAEEHLRLAAASGNADVQVVASMNLFALRVRRGDVALALEHAEHADRLLGEARHAPLLWGWNRIHLGIARSGAGRFAEGLADYDAAIAALTDAGAVPFVALTRNRLAEAQLLLGQTARAHALLSEGDEVLAPSTRAARLLVQADIARAMGRDAHALLREASALAAGSSPVYDQLRLAIAMLDLEDDVAAALSLSRELQQRALELHYLPLALRASRWRLEQLGPPPGRSQRGPAPSGRSERNERRGQERTGDDVELAVLAPAVEADTRRLAGPMVYLPQGLLACAHGYRRIGRDRDAGRCLVDAWRWIHLVALPNVPATMRDGFLERQRVNLAVRAAVAHDGLRVDQEGSAIGGA